MKKLYRKGTVHPSPPPSPMMSEQYLSVLPAAILTLAAELSAEDREVLAYLLLSSSNRPKRPSPLSGAAAARGSSGDHAPQFGCDCFRCYTSYWVRWGSSPNRQLIHEIIEAFEDHDHRNRGHAAGSGQKGGGARGGRRERRSNKQRGGGRGGGSGGGRGGGSGDGVVLSTGESKRAESEAVRGGEGEEEASAEKGSSQVRRLVSFIGERIWGVWG